MKNLSDIETLKCDCGNPKCEIRQECVGVLRDLKNGKVTYDEFNAAIKTISRENIHFFKTDRFIPEPMGYYKDREDLKKVPKAEKKDAYEFFNTRYRRFHEQIRGAELDGISNANFKKEMGLV